MSVGCQPIVCHFVDCIPNPAPANHLVTGSERPLRASNPRLHHSQNQPTLAFTISGLYSANDEQVRENSALKLVYGEKLNKIVSFTLNASWVPQYPETH